MEKNATTNTYSQVVVKALKDEDFKQKLIKDPVNTLREEGLEIPDGVNITVCEETNNQCFLILPEKPVGELSTEELESLAGGHGWLEHQMGTKAYYEQKAGLGLQSRILKPGHSVLPPGS